MSNAKIFFSAQFLRYRKHIVLNSVFGIKASKRVANVSHSLTQLRYEQYNIHQGINFLLVLC